MSLRSSSSTTNIMLLTQTCQPQVLAPACCAESHGGVTWVTVTLLLFVGAHPSCLTC